MNYPAQGASSVRPHAVQTTSGASSLALAYDADGNLAAQGTSTYTYDAEDRLVSRTVPGGIEQYRYDGNGNLLKRSSTADLSWTVYIGGVYELNSNGSTTKYYAALGQTLAVRSTATPGVQGTLKYPLHHHLGSTVAVVNEQGVVTGTETYWAYGGQRAGTGDLAGPSPTDPGSTTDKLYTAQRMEGGDAALGLYNYNARFYSTVLGAFVSADTVGDGLNRYSYVHGNPVRFTDPTGHCFTFSGVTFSCSDDTSDVLAWFNCALTCDNWIGDIARYGLSTLEFWRNVAVRAGDTSGALNASLILVFTRATVAGANDWDVVGNIGWTYFGESTGTSGEYFEASLRALISGNLGAMDAMSDGAFIGANQWWRNLSGMGGNTIAGYQMYKQLYHYFGTHVGSADAYFIRRTLQIAGDLPDINTNAGYDWSDDQLTVLWHDADGAYSPPGHFNAPNPYETDLDCVYYGECRGGGNEFWRRIEDILPEDPNDHPPVY